MINMMNYSTLYCTFTSVAYFPPFLALYLSPHVMQKAFLWVIAYQYYGTYKNHVTNDYGRVHIFQPSHLSATEYNIQFHIFQQIKDLG